MNGGILIFLAVLAFALQILVIHMGVVSGTKGIREDLAELKKLAQDTPPV